MKPFDLELAKQGHPVCTRDGRAARIICFDRKDKEFPVIALVDEGGDEEEFYAYRINGLYSFGGESRLDLFMADTTKHKGWINIYKRPEGYEDGGKIFESKEAAYNGRGYIGVPATTIEIEWED